ncbi:hypothetical protein C8R44DRAFT_983046 [Mycena epipterygia]|nr:hypothetical protein C8R44DRAFT_983035 [Mycena epipterygia]KAJ7117513.1 hypothetical protein C8R44DRAFT_983046 [Mycena epipterygia]
MASTTYLTLSKEALLHVVAQKAPSGGSACATIRGNIAGSGLSGDQDSDINIPEDVRLYVDNLLFDFAGAHLSKRSGI